MRVCMVIVVGLFILSAFFLCAYAGPKAGTPGDPDIVEGQRPVSPSRVFATAPEVQFRFIDFGAWLGWHIERNCTAPKERRCDISQKRYDGVASLRWSQR
ncbi:MAG: hypothetical protein ACUVUU_01440 [bacterium]